MRKIIVSTSLLFLTSIACYAQEQKTEKGISAEVDIFSTITKNEPLQINTIVFIQTPTRKHSKTKYTYLFSHEDKVWETLFGVSHEVLPNVHIGMSGGFEFHTIPTFRMGASALYTTEDFIAEILYEHGDGADNYWYKATLGYQIVPDLYLGLRAQRGIGIGTYAQIRLGQWIPYLMYGTEKIASEDAFPKERHRIDHVAVGLIKEF